MFVKNLDRHDAIRGEDWIGALMPEARARLAAHRQDRRPGLTSRSPESAAT